MRVSCFEPRNISLNCPRFLPNFLAVQNVNIDWKKAKATAGKQSRNAEWRNLEQTPSTTSRWGFEANNSASQMASEADHVPIHVMIVMVGDEHAKNGRMTGKQAQAIYGENSLP